MYAAANNTDMLLPSPQQDRFDQTYITASEICKELGVSRPALHYARRRGILPNPILVGFDMIYIWDRKEVRPYLETWKEQLRVKKGVPA